MIENTRLQNIPSTPLPSLAELEEETEDEEELKKWELTERRSMSVEDMARDIGATPAHKRTRVPTKTELAKERSKSPPQCRREAEDDKFFMPPPPPPLAVVITDSPSPVNDHEYGNNCNKKAHMQIMCSFHLKKTSRQCGQPGLNIITCGRPPKKGVRPQNLKPLPGDTPATPGPSKLYLIHKGKCGHFCSAPTLDSFQRPTHDKPCELRKDYGHQPKNYEITHKNTRSTFKSSNQKNTVRANSPLQLDLDTEVEPDLSIAQRMVYNQVCQEYEELIRRDGKWSAIFERLLSKVKITGAKVVHSFLYLLHKSRWQLVIPDHLNIESKPAKEFLIKQAHVNTGHAGLYKTFVELSNK